MSIWFDGHWDQTNVEGSADRSSRIDWKYDEIYSLIHQLQPKCMIGNNHHLSPLPGEDFQMFERDLPGQNKSGLSFQKASDALPLETCETMNNSWGFNMNDESYKSTKELIHYLVNAAGLNTNFLLNIGPMPNGKIQPEFVDTLKAMGKWTKKYGETIFGTRGGVVPPQDWGTVTIKDNALFVHLIKSDDRKIILIPGIKQKIQSISLFSTKQKINFNQDDNGVIISLDGVPLDAYDTVFQLMF
jgi:alpha-L-fucosidase